MGRRPSHPRARRCCGPSSLSPPVVSSSALLWAVVPLATCCLYSTLLWAVVPLVTCRPFFFYIIVHYSYFFPMIPLHPPLDAYNRSLAPPSLAVRRPSFPCSAAPSDTTFQSNPTRSSDPSLAALQRHSNLFPAPLCGIRSPTTTCNTLDPSDGQPPNHWHLPPQLRVSSELWFPQFVLRGSACLSSPAS